MNPLAARACFLRACRLDVAVRKPGNVSRASPGHGMQADLFEASARAAVGPMFVPGARVGARIEAAMAATWAAAGCNTNLGILLLAAPVAAAAERPGACQSSAALQHAVESTLAALDLEDARAAYRAIAMANPGGLGRVEHEDVRQGPTVGLRAAMALAAPRDSIARQYASGYADLFAVMQACVPAGFSLGPPDASDADAATAALVQRIHLEWMAREPDSHIVRKHGEALAHTVMSSAQGWRAHPAPGQDPAFAAWDEALKAAAINPGTSADLTVATLLLASLLENAGRAWHGT